MKYVLLFSLYSIFFLNSAYIWQFLLLVASYSFIVIGFYFILYFILSFLVVICLFCNFSQLSLVPPSILIYLAFSFVLSTLFVIICLVCNLSQRSLVSLLFVYSFPDTLLLHFSLHSFTLVFATHYHFLSYVTWPQVSLHSYTHSINMSLAADVVVFVLLSHLFLALII